MIAQNQKHKPKKHKPKKLNKKKRTNQFTEKIKKLNLSFKY